MKLKYLGPENTITKIVIDQPKVHLKPGEEFEADKECAEHLLGYRGYYVEVSAEKPKKEVKEPKKATEKKK